MENESIYLVLFKSLENRPVIVVTYGSTECRRIMFLTCGAIMAAPPQCAVSHKLQEIFTQWLCQYDHCIFS
jgi:hypothetical protein